MYDPLSNSDVADCAYGIGRRIALRAGWHAALEVGDETTQATFVALMDQWVSIDEQLDEDEPTTLPLMDVWNLDSAAALVIMFAADLNLRAAKRQTGFDAQLLNELAATSDTPPLCLILDALALRDSMLRNCITLAWSIWPGRTVFETVLHMQEQAREQASNSSTQLSEQKRTP